MPTIAEIIAAKKAGTSAAVATGKPATAAPTTKNETLAERAAHKEAIDRIDPPGKPAAAANARKMAGLILSKDMPAGPTYQERLASKVPEEPAPRSLGASEGETIDVTPLEAEPAIKDWHRAVNAFSTDLVIMRDPVDPERAWLAVRLEDEPLHPLLLKDLPIYDHPRAFRRPNEPF